MTKSLIAPSAIAMFLGLSACTNPYDPGQLALEGGVFEVRNSDFLTAPFVAKVSSPYQRVSRAGTDLRLGLPSGPPYAHSPISVRASMGPEIESRMRVRRITG